MLQYITLAISAMIVILIGVYILGNAGDDLECDNLIRTESISYEHIEYIPSSGWSCPSTGDSFTSLSHHDLIVIYGGFCYNCSTCALSVSSECTGLCDAPVADDSPLRSLYKETRSNSTTYTDPWYFTCVEVNESSQTSWALLTLVIIVIAAAIIMIVIRQLGVI